MLNNEFLHSIRLLGQKIIPVGSHLWLYGSQARGDAHPESDWDLLILLDKDKEEYADFNRFSFPFIELGIHHNIPVSAQIYTLRDWHNQSFSPFNHNVEHDKIVLV